MMKPNRWCKTHRTSGVWSTNKSLLQYWLTFAGYLWLLSQIQARLHTCGLSRAGSFMISALLSGTSGCLPQPPLFSFTVLTSQTGRITWRLTHFQTAPLPPNYSNVPNIHLLCPSLAPLLVLCHLRGFKKLKHFLTGPESLASHS